MRHLGYFSGYRFEKSVAFRYGGFAGGFTYARLPHSFSHTQYGLVDNPSKYEYNGKGKQQSLNQQAQQVGSPNLGNGAVNVFSPLVNCQSPYNFFILV